MAVLVCGVCNLGRGYWYIGILVIGYWFGIAQN
jgi:hypothetical protein